jgi:circadian clock protein KaiC
MTGAALSTAATAPGLIKAPTGIAGLDELTGGGLPAGRATLVCGGAGCGKTLLAASFLANGALCFDEPGVFMGFEETAADLGVNAASIGFDLERLAAEKRIVVDYVHVQRSEIEETGEYDLEGLFIRLGYAIDSIGARRVVLDTIETLFGGLSDEAVLRAELRRLFGWLKDKGVSAIITGERGAGQLTRHGLEEYVSDCVIVLDHRVQYQVSTRRLRIVKYRGSAHGTNEYPFLIDGQGLSVVPITGAGLDHVVSDERVSSGIADLDEMLGGQGYYRGSSILVSGMAGAGKTSVATHFADAACGRGDRCLYFAFEESPSQLSRNMRSIGFELDRRIGSGLLRISATRPSLYGLEMHLAAMHRQIEQFEPAALVVDPVSSLMSVGEQGDVHAMLLRLIDHLKARGCAALFTELAHGSMDVPKTDVGISSLMDSWLLLLNREAVGEHNRQLYLLKSRGMAHSNQVREFLLSERGIELQPAYLGPDGVLTGSSRVAQEARDRAAAVERRRSAEERRLAQAHRRRQIERQIEDLQAELAAASAADASFDEEARALDAEGEASRLDLACSRRVGHV